MCLMITKPASIKINKQYLEDAFERNPDGAGFAYATGSRVRTIRPMWKFEDFYAQYLRFEHMPMLIHFRLATHGDLNEANTHPHPITRRLAMAHNGIIYGVTLKGDESDTRAFIREHVYPVLSKYGVPAITHPKSVTAYEKVIGASKLSFLDSDGNFTYANKDLGHEHDGCWWSNKSYLEDRVQWVWKDTKPYQHAPRVNYDCDWWERTPLKCLACGLIHQRRDCKTFSFRSGELLPERSRGLTVPVCKGCLKNTGTICKDISLGSESFPKQYNPELLEFVARADVEERELREVELVNGVLWEDDCACCGRRTLRPAMQRIQLDKKIPGVCSRVCVCRECLGEIGVSRYDPINEVICDENSPVSKAIAATANEAQLRHQNLQQIKAAEIARVYERGWICEMCGEDKLLTVQLPDGTRMCRDCNDCYRDNNFDWTRTCRQLYSDLAGGVVSLTDTRKFKTSDTTNLNVVCEDSGNGGRLIGFHS